MIKRIIALSLILLMIGCSQDFMENPMATTDPNVASEIGVNDLFVAIQSNMYGVLSGPSSFLVSAWMQQTDHFGCTWGGRFAEFDIDAEHFTDVWSRYYSAGGLLDLKKMQEKAYNRGKYTYIGIAKMWEALLMSTAADLWGNIPYSQAVQIELYENPEYDKQSEVHDAILDLIDSAVQDFQTAQAEDEFFDGSYDFTYKGNVDKWIAAAHTLKARILLNWAEVRPNNYVLALDEAQQGIASDEDNWKAHHSEKEGEESMYWQFMTRRFTIRACYYIVELLKAHCDPRLQIYFDKDDLGEYSGSSHFAWGSGWGSPLNERTFGAVDWKFELVSWFENQFIVAECQYFLGNETAALSTLNDIIQPGLEVKWGLDAGSLPRYEGLTYIDLLEAIMLEKYKAMFLNIQVWSDWRRTAFPIVDYLRQNHRIPRRFLYPDAELSRNPNVPVYEDPLYQRVENDRDNPDYSATGRIVNP